MSLLEKCSEKSEEWLNYKYDVGWGESVNG